jgi:hypothetical protein
MTQKFATLGVTAEHIERYLGHPLDKTLVDEMVDLQGVYNAIKEGAKASDYFNANDEHGAGNDAATAIVNKGKEAGPAKGNPKKDASADKGGENAAANSKHSKEGRKTEQKPEPTKEAAPTQQDDQKEQDDSSDNNASATGDEVF